MKFLTPLAPEPKHRIVERTKFTLSKKSKSKKTKSKTSKASSHARTYKK